MAEQLSRREALRILALPGDADHDAVKQAYRRLARTTHPDAGGDPEQFRTLQRAYDRLIDSPSAARERRRTPPRTRPSRQRRHAHSPTQLYADPPVDVTRLDWEPRETGEGLSALDHDTVARAVVRPHPGPVHPLTARSRGPRSLLNRWLQVLADDLIATLEVRAASSRGRPGHDVELRLQVRSRKHRRRVEATRWPADWVLTRGSSSTTVVRVLAPSTDRRATAAHAAGVLREGLDRLGWPLSSWYVPAEELG